MKELIKRVKFLGIHSSFHSIPKIGQAKRLSIKILLIVCFILSFCFCTWTLVTNVEEYFNYKVRTVIELHHNEDADFPTITLCQKQICALESDEYSKFIEFYTQKTYNTTK